MTAQKWQICWEFPGRFFAKKVTKFHVFQCVLRSGHHNDLIRSALCYPDLEEHFITLSRVRSTPGKFSTALRSLMTIILIYHQPVSNASHMYLERVTCLLSAVENFPGVLSS